MVDRTPIIRTSERRDFLRCEWRWWKLWREGLSPRGSASTPLWFGTGVHLSLALWYTGPGKKRGIPPVETWMKWSEQEIHNMRLEKPTGADEIEAVWIDARELGRVLMEEYVKRWGRDEHKLYIEPERTFSLDIPWPDGRQAVYEAVEGLLLAKYVGTYDGVWRHADTGLIWLDETKTAKAISTAHLPLDPQAGSYWATAPLMLRRDGLIGPKENLAGIQYNFIRKALPDDRPKDAEGYATNKPTKEHYLAALDGVDNWTVAELKKKKVDELESIAVANFIQVLGERSKQQPAPLFLRHDVHRTGKERRQQLRRIQDDAMRMQVLRDRILPLTKNPSRECTFDCPVYSLCELDEKGGDVKQLQKLAFRVQDPYADHRDLAKDE